MSGHQSLMWFISNYNTDPNNITRNHNNFIWKWHNI